MSSGSDGIFHLYQTNKQTKLHITTVSYTPSVTETSQPPQLKVSHSDPRRLKSRHLSLELEKLYSHLAKSATFRDFWSGRQWHRLIAAFNSRGVMIKWSGCIGCVVKPESCISAASSQLIPQKCPWARHGIFPFALLSAKTYTPIFRYCAAMPRVYRCLFSNQKRNKSKEDH